MYSAYTRNTEKNILILVFMVFLSLFFFLLAENRGTGWLGWHLSSEKKKREKKNQKKGKSRHRWHQTLSKPP